MADFIRIISKAIMVVMILGVIIGLCLLFCATARCRAKVARLRAAGQPTTVAELNSPHIPDSENAAISYRRVFKEVSTRDVMGPCGQLLSITSKPLPRDWDRMKQALKHHQGVFSLVEQALARPHCGIGDFAPLPNIPDRGHGGFRSLGFFLSAAAMVDARNGRVDKSLYDLELLFRVASHLNDREDLIGELLRVIMIVSGSRGLQEAIRYGQIDESQFRRLDSILGKINLSDSYAHSLTTERAITLEMMAMISAQQSPLSGMVDGDTNVFLDKIGQEINAASHAAIPGSLARAPQPFDSVIHIACSTHSMAPSYAGIRTRILGGMSQLAVDRAALALSAYHQRYGSYPGSLRELETRLKWRVPKDECSGRDLHYQRKGSGYLLYSIGPDLKDDGGVPWWKYPRCKTSNEAPWGDIVMER